MEIETTDTAETKSMTALLDSGVTGECIDSDYARSCQFNLIKLTQLILVYNVDRSPNEAGSITEVVSVRGHPPNPVPITKPDNHVSTPAPTSIPTPYIPPHRQVHLKIPL